MMSLKEVSEEVRGELLEKDFEIIEEDLKRPWGGFFRINDSQIERFLTHYFPGFKPDSFSQMSPKILIFSPNSRLSWQVHQRRAEMWQVLKGPIGVYLSKTDEQPQNPEIYKQTERIIIPSGTRHRNAKLINWGIVAEIWVHINPQSLSDEDDIERISDDYGRN